jgi:predicted ATPase
VSKEGNGTAQPLITRLRIKNYRSIGACDLAVGRLTALVGRNGAGKSNVLDALRFVADALRTTLDHALRDRGGLATVRRISTGHPRNFSMSVDLALGRAGSATYAFEIAARAHGAIVVRREELRLRESGVPKTIFRVDEGTIRVAGDDPLPVASADRLFLVAASGLPSVRPVYDALTSMGFYSLNPDSMKRPQSPDAGELLHRDGINIASVVARLAREAPAAKQRVLEYLRLVVPEVADFERVDVGPQETLQFRQEVAGASNPWSFYAMSMSDGTLRALGILVALHQIFGSRREVRLVGVEEPETALHPAAAGAMIDALREASKKTQVLLTTHSAELLDHLRSDDTLLAVQSESGTTRVGEIDEASKQAIKDHLYTPGELLRMDQLAPRRRDHLDPRQLKMFDSDNGDDET